VPYAAFSNKEVLLRVQDGERLAKPRRCPEVLYDTIMFPLWISSTQERLMASQARDGLRKALANDELMTTPKLEEEEEEAFVPLQQRLSDERYAVMETNPSYIPVQATYSTVQETGADGYLPMSSPYASQTPSTSKATPRSPTGPTTTVNFTDEDPWMVSNPSYVHHAGQDEPSSV